MTNSAVPSRSIRIRTLAVIGALAIGLGLVPAQAAVAAPTTGTVSGVISNAVTGEGVSGLSITLQADDFSSVVGTSTGADGAYSFAGVAPGGYSVYVNVWGLPYQHPWGQNHVTVTESEPDQALNISLTPHASGTSVLTGSIIDSQSGLPIDGSLSLQGLSVVYSGNATSSSGTYSIGGLAAGTYSLSVSVSGYLFAHAQVVVTDAETTTYDVLLTQLDAVITGRITDPAGNGIPNLWVSANGSQFGGSSLTDADGYYTIANIAPGDYEVWAGGTPTVWTGRQVPTTAVADAEVTVDIQLAERTTSFVSSAVFDQNYNGIQYICVDLIDAATGAVVESTETWVDAVFGFPEVADGTYTFYLHDCAVSRPRVFESVYLGGGATLHDAETFTVDGPADDQRPDDIFLSGPATGWIILAVTDAATGNPVTTKFTGSLVHDSVSYPIEDWTESGTLQIRDLPYGEYEFTVAAEGYAERRVASVAIDASTPEHILDVQLEPLTTGSITVAVTDSASGAPIPGAVVSYTDGDGSHSVVDGDGDGIIGLGDLAFGDYVLTATASGYVGTTLGAITIDAGAPDANAAARLVAVRADDDHGHGKGHHRHGKGHGYGHDKHGGTHHDTHDDDRGGKLHGKQQR